MKLTIKEIKEKCEADDPVKFKATVDKVWDFKEKITKYYIGYQNIIVKDDTDKIKVIFSKIKKQEDIYKDDIEGKEVEISGTVSFYTNPNSGEKEINIFGALTFEKEEEEPKTQGGAVETGELRVAKQPGLTGSEIRLKCLFIAKGILALDNPKAIDLVEQAIILERYVRSSPGIVGAKPKETKKKEQQPEREQQEEDDESKKENGDVGKLSQERIKQINMLMALAENRGEKGKYIISDKVKREGYKSAKELTDQDIKDLTRELEEMGTEDIPF